MWLWSAVLPLCWALVLALRVLAWQIGLFGNSVYHRTVDAAVERWWSRRSLGLPVQHVWLIGPAGDVQENYQGLMADASLPKPLKLRESSPLRLCCPFSLSNCTSRAPELARFLARMALKLPELKARWPTLRGVAWMGDEGSQTAFISALGKEGMVLPEARLPLRDLADLDALIDAFYLDCRDKDDWVLCAGVLSVESVEDVDLPGEAGFLWLVSWQGRQVLHRGEYLDETHPSVTSLCAQMQRYAAIDSAPPACLAMDKQSQKAFVEGGWTAAKHQLAGHWGLLAHIAPFIGMSLALLHAGKAGQPCGWLSQDGNKRLAIGVAVPHDDE
ncbi:TPA: hypothetical protein SAN82_004543 [Pseudomonas putida]|nr:hypothetical protein [Pseudomonas putida]